LKILYHHRIGSRDGQAVHLEELIAALRRAGAEVIVVGPESFARASFGHNPRFISALKSLVPKAAYELLELGYNFVAYRRLEKAWRAHKPDVIYERYNLNLVAGIWLSRRHRVPLLLEVNAPLMKERASFDGIALRRLAKRVEASTWKNAHCVLPVTQVLANEVRDAGVNERRIRVIPNGIDKNNFSMEIDGGAIKAALGLSNKLVIGFTGFIRSWHGLDSIIDWLATQPAKGNIHALIVGDGPARHDLEQQVLRLGISDRVTFTGLVDRHSISRMVAAFDIAVQPKSVPYASPLKLFEYMAMAKAILAPDQPNIREVLENEVSALLFDPNDRHSMVQAMQRLAEDSALRAKLGAAALRTIRDRDYTWDGNARRVLEIARDCLRSPGKEEAIGADWDGSCPP
jgi:glycosyltransferase involved in cell wall biosynthesis